jgi:apoptosis-inducing factor 2
MARTTTGIELAVSLVLLCPGQVPNTALMKELVPDSIVTEGDSQGMVYVKRTLQVAILISKADVEEDDVTDKLSSLNVTEGAPFQDAAPVLVEESNTPESTEAEDDAHLSVPYPHIFCVGDAADAFGAINAGHTAYFQSHVASENIIALARAHDA